MPVIFDVDFSPSSADERKIEEAESDAKTPDEITESGSEPG